MRAGLGWASCEHGPDPVALGPPLPAPLVGCFHISVATADNMLYGMSANHDDMNRQHSFEAMSRTPPSAMDEEEDYEHQRRPPWSWTWRSVPSPPPFGADDTVTAYALHPDGRTVFMSAHRRRCPRLPTGTVSFNTELRRWKWHGEWALPFHGRGHYAADLDAWVGLGDDGRVCSCQIVSRTAPATSEPPEWKTVVKDDKLLLNEVPERRMSVSRPSLADMGDEAGFCLAEFVVRRGVDLKHALRDADGCVLRMSTFRLRYDHKGELHTAGLRTNSFIVSKHLWTVSPDRKSVV